MGQVTSQAKGGHSHRVAAQFMPMPVNAPRSPLTASCVLGITSLNSIQKRRYGTNTARSECVNNVYSLREPEKATNIVRLDMSK